MPVKPSLTMTFASIRGGLFTPRNVTCVTSKPIFLLVAQFACDLRLGESGDGFK